MDSLPKKKVLIIDDNAALRRAVSRLLRREFAVTEAASADEALREILCVAFDVVLLDLQMPDCDGWEMHRRIATQDARLAAHARLGSARCSPMAAMLKKCLVGSFECGIVVITVITVMTVVTIGCAKSSPPAPSKATSSSTVAAAPIVDLQPLAFSFRGQPIARLFTDGRTESAGPNAPGSVLVPGPTLHADGTMVMTKGGVTARLDDKGDVYVVGPAGANPREQLFGRIAGDQLTVAGSARSWSVRVRGNMIEFGKENSSQIDGVVTPSMRHTALVMAAAFYIDGALAAP